jgi:hypothetical protein
VYLGSDTRASADNAQNEIVIGYNAIGSGSNTIQLGNTSITDVKTSGTVTAAGFKIPGGTSGQYLRADGTLSSQNLGVLVFSKGDDMFNEFWTANLDGTNQNKISISIPVGAYFDKTTIKISPDGNKFFFIVNLNESAALDALYSCNADGSGLTKLIDNAVKFSDIK